MKRYIVLLFVLLILPVFSETGIVKTSISKIQSETAPFTGMREPANDSLYNALDGDVRTSSFFSDFKVEFSNPIEADAIVIINGKSNDFKKFARLKNIEITLYTSKIKPEKKTDSQKKKKDDPADKSKIKKPVDKEQNKKDNKEYKNSRLTAKNDSIYSEPVRGTLKEVLAEEPVIEKKEIKDGNSDIQSETGSEIKPSKSVKKEEAGSDPDSEKSPDTEKDKKINNVENNKSVEIEADKINSEKNLKETDNKIEIKKTDKDKVSDVKSKKTKILDRNKNKKKTSYKRVPKIHRIKDGDNLRIIIYITLNDVKTAQSIKLGGLYTIQGFSMRQIDNSYSGQGSSAPYLTDLLFAKGKNKIMVDGLGPLKKEYEENFRQVLKDSINGKVFSVFEGLEEKARILFSNDGNIKCRERFSCGGKGESDCVCASMPDKWKIMEGRLYFRYQKKWLQWKYELSNENDLLNVKIIKSDPGWFKFYIRNEKEFTNRYLLLEKTVPRVWKWD
ncbi:MAG TPA: hypothetical protein PK358_05055 [Spirochaetota bacterium]|nr:hypothetical protein [Spirochaetota bacterium]HPJ34182.1 hypothetical protein [Spirochaetota bacterium]